MVKLNNKGQSLVMFILVIPILLGVMALVIDMGSLYVKKNEMDNVIEFVLDYGLDNEGSSDREEFSEEVVQDGLENTDIEEALDDSLVTREEDLRVLLDYNLVTSQNEVMIDDNKIVISSKDYVEGIFSRILNFNGFSIESEYMGYIEDDKKIIQKVK